MKLSALGGLISAAFLSVLLVVAFAAAFHYWQQVQLPRIGSRKKQRMRKLMRIWILAAIVIAVIGLGGAAVYVLAPAAILIQSPEKHYVTIKHNTIDPFAVGKSPVLKLKIENGPGHSKVVFSVMTFVLTRFVPEKYLRYDKTVKDQVITIAPHQTVETRWEGAPILTQDDINDLHADIPLAELYIFARGHYSTEAGTTGSLDVCFKYDRGFSAHLAICESDIKIE